MVEAQVQAEEDEDTGGDVLWKTAVEIHGLVDPVTVTQVPYKTAEIAKSSALTASKCVALLIVAE
jgi:hypothetical protein